MARETSNGVDSIPPGSKGLTEFLHTAVIPHSPTRVISFYIVSASAPDRELGLR